jgi:hypothetical protein
VRLQIFWAIFAREPLQPHMRTQKRNEVLHTAILSPNQHDYKGNNQRTNKDDSA